MKASPQALAAVRAVKNIRNWGSEAAWRYAERRGVTNEMLLAALHVEQRRLIRKKAARLYENAVKVEAAERGISIQH